VSPTVNRTCAHCGHPMLAYFKLQRFDANGDPKMNVELCSLVCLLQWLHTTTVERGADAVAAAKGAFTRLVDMFRGPKLPPKS